MHHPLLVNEELGQVNFVNHSNRLKPRGISARGEGCDAAPADRGRVVRADPASGLVPRTLHLRTLERRRPDWSWEACGCMYTYINYMEYQTPLYTLCRVPDAFMYTTYTDLRICNGSLFWWVVVMGVMQPLRTVVGYRKSRKIIDFHRNITDFYRKIMDKYNSKSL